MQSKSMAAITVLLVMVASLVVSGCTTSNTGTLPTETATPYATVTTTPTYTPTSSANGGVVSPTEYANQMTTNFKNNYDSSEAVVIQPFTYKSVNGTPTFTAVIKDGSKKLTVWQHTLTYTLCKDREEARSVFAQEKTNAQSKGYGEANSLDTLYHAYIGAYDAVGSKEVTINVCGPDNSCGYSYYLSFEQYFPVVTDYKTRLE